MRSNTINKNLCFVIFLVLTILMQVDLAHTKQGATHDNPAFLEGEIIVKFKEALPSQDQDGNSPIFSTGFSSIDALNSLHSVTALEKTIKGASTTDFEKTRSKFPMRASRSSVNNFNPGYDKIYTLKFDPSSDVLAVLEDYRQNPHVEFAQPNYIYAPDLVPNDPQFGTQYAHNVTSAIEGWDTQTGNSSIIIAIVGQGINYSHEDLADNMWNNTNETIDGSDDDNNTYTDDIRGWDWIEDDNDPMPSESHETQVAGVAAGVGNNAVGITGLCWNCKLMNLKASYTTADIANAIDYATNNGADIISMSFGNYDIEKYGPDSLVKTSVDNAYAQGIYCVATAGNDDITTKRYPAALGNVTAVGSTDSTDARSGFSNYGSWVDVSAPGSAILTTDLDGTYTTVYGTSYSCPYVSGLAALLWSERSELTVEQVRSIIEYSADKIRMDRYVGPRINVSRALTYQDTPGVYAIIKSPDSNEIFTSGNISFNGTAIGDSYELNYTSTSTENWQSISTGNECENCNLGNLSTNELPSGEYVALLTVQNTTHTDTHNVTFFIEKSLQEGWPQTTASNILSPPTVFDIDNDGDMEIFAGNNAGELYAWHHDGTSLNANWPTSLLQAYVYGSPAIGDISGDGEYDIICTSYGSNNRSYAWHINGSVIAGWPFNLSYQTRSSPVLVDLNNDSILEVILADQNGSIYILNGSAGLQNQWYIADGNLQAHLAAGDIDDDGDIEIIASTWYTLIAYHHNGTVVSGWSGLDAGNHITPLIADVDNNGDMEIIAGGDNIRILNHDGSLMTTSYALVQTAGAFGVGDIDNDGDLEIFIGESNGTVYGIHHNGTIISGWPKSATQQVKAAPVIGDIDGDGQAEVIVGSYDKKLYAWNADGTPVSGWPKSGGDFLYRAAAISDIDADGDIEVLVGSNNKNFYVWDLNATYDITKVYWPKLQHNERNTGVYSNLTFNDTAPPSLTLISPADLYEASSATNVFNCSASDNYGLKNLTFYWNCSGSWEPNGTITFSNSSSGYLNVTRTCYSTQVAWNCLAYDNYTTPNSAYAVNNNSLTLNLNPAINSSRLNSQSNTTNESLIGYCNASHPQNKNISYSWELYLDGVLNQSGLSYQNGSCTAGHSDNGDGTCSFTLQTADTEVLEDTYVYLSKEDYNYGSSDTAWLRNHNLYAGRAYYKFNITAIPWLAELSQSDLSLYSSNYFFFNDNNVSAHHVFDASWIEGNCSNCNCSNTNTCSSGITWLTQPCGSSFNETSVCNLTAENWTIIDSAGTWFNWSITNMLSKANTEGNSSISIALKTDEVNTILYAELSTKEESNSSLHPEIIVTYTPHEGYIPGQEINVVNISNNSLSIGQSWILRCKASDETSTSQWLNSSEVVITDGNNTLAALSVYASVNETALANTTIWFYANYTNYSAHISSADCNISFDDGTSEMMNDSGNQYNYSRNFSSTGLKAWNVTCNKSGFQTRTAASTINITSPAVDLAPNCTLISPGNYNLTNNMTIEFNCSASDDNQLSNITLYGNWSGWHANETTHLSSTENSTVFQKNLTDGNYTWNCAVLDNASQTAWAQSNYTVSIDTIAPIIALERPENNTIENTTNTIAFSFNATDSGGFSECSLILNSQVNYSNSSIISGEAHNVTLNLSYGYYNWSINCTDRYSNSNMSAIYYLNVSNATNSTGNQTNATSFSIELFSPSNNSTWTSSTTVTFSYNVTSTYNLSVCSLYINEAYDQNSTNVSSNQTETFTKTLSNGAYNWSVSCNDSQSNQTNSSTNLFTVNYAASPPGGSPGGGGGSSRSDDQDTIPENVRINTLTDVKAQQEIDWYIGDFICYQIKGISKSDADEAQITLTSLHLPPSGIPVLEEAYGYFKVESTGVDLDSVKLGIQVSTEWIRDQDLVVKEFAEGWRQIPSKFAGSVGENTFYEASPNLLGVYAIQSTPKAAPQVTTIKPHSKTVENLSNFSLQDNQSVSNRNNNSKTDTKTSNESLNNTINEDTTQVDENNWALMLLSYLVALAIVSGISYIAYKKVKKGLPKKEAPPTSNDAMKKENDQS